MAMAADIGGGVWQRICPEFCCKELFVDGNELMLRPSVMRAAVWVAGLCCLISPSPAQQPSDLSVAIVEGQGAMLNVRAALTRDLVVRVEGAGGQPVAGASVAFTLPSQGASGEFLGGQKSLIVTTGADGRATARGLKPNRIAGKYEIRVTASQQGRTASANITVFNMEVKSAKSGSNTKWIVLLVAAGGAGAAGAILGTRNSSPSRPTTPPAPPTVTISVGTGTVGAPQ